MKKIYLALLCVSFAFISNGQKIVRSVVGSCGASASVGTTQLNYTVGEAMVSYLVSNGSPIYKLRGGFQQSDTVAGSIGIRKIQTGFLKNVFNLSPNPANQVVKINYEITAIGEINYNIYNSFGQLCLSIDQGLCLSGSNENSLDLENLAAGSYVIVVNYSNTDAVYVTNLPLIIIK